MNQKEWSPYRIILVSYLSIILLGTLMLKLPISTTKDISFLDAFFTSTSAVTVTGLVVLDTEKDLTLFGKFIVLSLIQIGGLGYLTITTYTLVLLRRKVGLKERLILSESINYPGIYGLIRFFKRVVPVVVILEILGFIMLIPSMYDYSKNLGLTLFYALFHSISAFNNAGFSTFSSNLVNFRADTLVNLVVCFLVIVGGIGFFVVYDLIAKIKGEVMHISTHTKLVIVASFFLIILGALVIFIDLYHWQNLSVKEKVLASFFHSVVSRTAGFNTIDISKLSEATLFFIVNLMFIGASPGGTGGGVKTVTMSVILVAVYSYIKGQSEVVIFERSISQSVIYKAMVILSISFAYTTISALIVSWIEHKPLLHCLFEVVSAFSTVGLSLGNSSGLLSLSADFSLVGKLIIILTMIVGRIGILSFMFAISGRQKVSFLKHPEARILI